MTVINHNYADDDDECDILQHGMMTDTTQRAVACNESQAVELGVFIECKTPCMYFFL
jgi:hypothetical protein